MTEKEDPPMFEPLAAAAGLFFALAALARAANSRGFDPVPETKRRIAS